MANETKIKLTNDDIEKLIEIWKVLEILTVSLDRIGFMQTQRGEEYAKDQLIKYFSPPRTRQIVKARRLIIEILEQDEDIDKRLDELADDQATMGYWTEFDN